MVSGCHYAASASTIHRLLGYRGHKATAAAAAAAGAANPGGTGGEATASGLALVRGVAGTAAADELSLGSQCVFGRANKLWASKLLVDEVSMMDVPLAAALLNAIK